MVGSWMKRAVVATASAAAVLGMAACGARTAPSPFPEEARARVLAEVEAEMLRKIDLWYPRVIDNEYGGFLSNFTYDWQQMESQEKMIVTQARHVWTLSKLAERFPERRDEFLRYARHGFEFLRDRMWDQEYGGFYVNVNRAGEPAVSRGGTISKTLYGNVFAIYGLAAYYGASGDAEALELAQRTFRWLDENARDPVHGGYFQNLNRQGQPTGSNPLKDYNSGIHTLEAFYELYRVWPDPLMRQRLEEMFYIIRDRFVQERGYLQLYFQADWTPITFRDSSEAVIRANLGRDHITPGHDIETAYLILEAAHALGWENDTTTARITKRLVDHTIETSFDESVGGVYDVAYYMPGDTDKPTIIEDTKNWWAQAETLNSLLLMAERYPDDPHRYFDKFLKQWNYINEYLIDHEHGGWYDAGIDKQPQARTNRKAQVWKGNYHTLRALLEVSHRLGQYGHGGH